MTQLDNIHKFVENCQNCNTILETLADDTHIEVTSFSTGSINEEVDIKTQFYITETLESEIHQPEEIANANMYVELCPKFKCFKCQKLCTTKRSLAAHMASHRKDKIYECPECSVNFPYAEYLMRHSLNVHGTETKPFVCNICQEGFLRKRTLEEHKNFHTGETPYVCTHCGQRFKVSRHFYKHMYLLHNPNLSKTPKYKRKYVEKRVHLHLECKECGKIFASRSGFSNHQLIHEGIKKFLCSTCGKQFITNAQLQKHLKCHKDRNKIFNCADCDKTFTSTKTLLIHSTKMHTSEETHKCSQCHKVFNTKDDLVEHLNTHVESYPCSYCEKTFNKKSKLQVHIQIHLNRFKCDICSKKFSCASHLNGHMRIHTGEKPFMCTVCGKTFSQKQTLTVHMRIHYGITPFECSNCDKKYHDSTNLRRHFKRHHENRKEENHNQFILNL